MTERTRQKPWARREGEGGEGAPLAVVESCCLAAGVLSGRALRPCSPNSFRRRVCSALCARGDGGDMALECEGAREGEREGERRVCGM